MQELSLISRSVARLEPRVASESRIPPRQKSLLDNPMQNVGRDIIFKPVLPSILMPAENKTRDVPVYKPKAKIQLSVEPKLI